MPDYSNYRSHLPRGGKKKPPRPGAASSVVLGPTKSSAVVVEAYCNTWYNTEDVLALSPSFVDYGVSLNTVPAPFAPYHSVVP